MFGTLNLTTRKRLRVPPLAMGCPQKKTGWSGSCRTSPLKLALSPNLALAARAEEGHSNRTESSQPKQRPRRRLRYGRYGDAKARLAGGGKISPSCVSDVRPSRQPRCCRIGSREIVSA